MKITLPIVLCAAVVLLQLIQIPRALVRVVYDMLHIAKLVCTIMVK